jgi:hypothetical protein
MITVGATVTALAVHDGPLWEKMCYGQIGGLLTAIYITKLLVPVIYSICEIIQWDCRQANAEQPVVEAARGAVSCIA